MEDVPMQGALQCHFSSVRLAGIQKLDNGLCGILGTLLEGQHLWRGMCYFFLKTEMETKTHTRTCAFLCKEIWER